MKCNIIKPSGSDLYPSSLPNPITSHNFSLSYYSHKMDPPAVKLTITSPSPTSPSDPPPVSPYLPTPPPEALLPSSLAAVYVPTPIHPTALAYAKTKFARVIPSHEMSPEEAWPLTNGVICRANLITREMLDKAGKSMGLAIVGVGYDSIDIEGCKEKGVTLMS